MKKVLGLIVATIILVLTVYNTNPVYAQSYVIVTPTPTLPLTGPITLTPTPIIVKQIPVTTELPKTGPPPQAAALIGLLPFGFWLIKIGGTLKTNKNSAKYIWDCKRFLNQKVDPF